MRLGVSYISAFLPHHIEADMKDLRRMGCNEVLFAIQENHFSYLNGAVHYGAGIAKAQGLTPYAVVWGFANTFGGGRMSTFVPEHPDVLAEDRDGRKLTVVCYNQPLVAEQLCAYAHLLIEHGFEGLFVDEPTKQACYCALCREKFVALYGDGELLEEQNEDRLKQFQGATIASFVRRVSSAIKLRHPSAKLMCCLMPYDKEIWNDAAKLADLDDLGTDPYWLSVPDLTLDQAVSDGKQLKDICGKYGKRSHLWLNCWGIPDGVEDEIYKGGKLLAATGCDALYTWSYKGGLGTNEVCQNPAKAWASVERLYRELAGLDEQ